MSKRTTNNSISAGEEAPAKRSKHSIRTTKKGTGAADFDAEAAAAEGLGSILARAFVEIAHQGSEGSTFACRINRTQCALRTDDDIIGAIPCLPISQFTRAARTARNRSRPPITHFTCVTIACISASVIYSASISQITRTTRQISRAPITYFMSVLL
jgi:hypothetical protein